MKSVIGLVSAACVAGSGACGGDSSAGPVPARGELDPTFGGTGLVMPFEGWGRAVVAEPGGSVLVLADVPGVSYGLIRFDEDGALDSTFGNGHGRRRGHLDRREGAARR
jgi:hypothetical protein